jgi:tetratricopeptide (TPR) repeat protein
MLEGALRIALESDLATAALRAYYNLAECLYEVDRCDEALTRGRDGVALARRLGDRAWEWGLVAQTANPLYVKGEWDEVAERAVEVPDDVRSEASNWHEFFVPLARIHAARGEVEEATRLLSALASLADSSDLDERTIYEVGLAVVRRSEGRHAEAVLAGERAMQLASHLGGHRDAMEGMIEATEAAFALVDLEKVESLLDWCSALPVGERIQYLQAQEARLGARLAAERRELDEVEPRFNVSAGLFRELGMPFYLAVTLLEHGEWLVSVGRAGEVEPLLAEAREIFERLKAQPWLGRLELVAGSQPAAVSALPAVNLPR